MTVRGQVRTPAPTRAVARTLHLTVSEHGFSHAACAQDRSTRRYGATTTAAGKPSRLAVCMLLPQGLKPDIPGSFRARLTPCPSTALLSHIYGTVSRFDLQIHVARERATRRGELHKTGGRSRWNDGSTTDLRRFSASAPLRHCPL